MREEQREIQFKRHVEKFSLHPEDKGDLLKSFKQSRYDQDFYCGNDDAMFPKNLRFVLKVLNYVVYIEIC